jgi:hypothetical protein
MLEGVTYPLAIGIVKGLELNDIGVTNNAHDLQFTILIEVSEGHEFPVPISLC